MSVRCKKEAQEAAKKKNRPSQSPDVGAHQPTFLPDVVGSDAAPSGTDSGQQPHWGFGAGWGGGGGKLG